MSLLHFLCAQGKYVVSAAHFHHGLRGREADRDEAFVRDYCARQGIPCFSGRGDTRALARSERLTTEEAARRLRYEFLYRIAEEQDCKAILTAHHADDSAETMLLNLLRGTGSAGLGGIPQISGKVLRPFLNLRRDDLSRYAAAHDIPHVEDETNHDAAAADRNYLRAEVLPRLKELNPKAVENMSRAAEILRSESAAIESIADRICAEAETTGTGVRIRCAALEDAPQAIRRRALLRLLADASGGRRDLTERHVAAAEQVLERPGAETDLPRGMRARREGGELVIERTADLPEECVLETDAICRFGGWEILLTDAPRNEVPADWRCELVCAPGSTVTVSSWRSRDRLPDIRGGSRSLKRLFLDHGIGLARRETLPVVRIDGSAAAVPGISVAEREHRAGERTVWILFRERKEEDHDE